MESMATFAHFGSSSPASTCFSMAMMRSEMDSPCSSRASSYCARNSGTECSQRRTMRRGGIWLSAQIESIASPSDMRSRINWATAGS